MDAQKLPNNVSTRNFFILGLKQIMKLLPLEFASVYAGENYLYFIHIQYNHQRVRW
jgi:hypothetical protein